MCASVTRAKTHRHFLQYLQCKHTDTDSSDGISVFRMHVHEHVHISISQPEALSIKAGATEVAMKKKKLKIILLSHYQISSAKAELNSELALVKHRPVLVVHAVCWWENVQFVFLLELNLTLKNLQKEFAQTAENLQKIKTCQSKSKNDLNDHSALVCTEMHVLWLDSFRTKSRISV